MAAEFLKLGNFFSTVAVIVTDKPGIDESIG